MAEIKIEKKKPVWPWIILVLIILGILAYFLIYKDRIEENQDYNASIPLTNIPATNDSINYKSSAKESTYPGFNREVEKYLIMLDDRSRLGNDVEFTRTILMQLTNAVQATFKEKNIQNTGEQSNTKISVQGKDSNSDSENLATNIKETGERIASILGTEQQQEFPDLTMETVKIKNATSQVKPNLDISQQQDNIVAFFDSCGNLLKKLEQEK